MRLRPPENPSLSDRAYLFLKTRLSCAAALLCLFGGFFFAIGLGVQDWRLIILGGLLMLPYVIPATLFLLEFIFALLVFVPVALWICQIKPLLEFLKKRFQK